MNRILRRYTCFCFLLTATAGLAQVAAPDQAGVARAPASEPMKGSLALSPAVAMMRGKPGQTVTQALAITNELSSELRFDVEIQDVVIRDGKRVYRPAGQVPNSIALGAVASPASVVVPGGQTASATVTLTMPANTPQRAVVIFFRTKVGDTDKDSLAFGASLGALMTFNLSEDVKVKSGPLSVTPQTASANVDLSEELENTGAEPVVPKGVLAILDERGKRMAKAAFDPHRLLPGEKSVFKVTSPVALRPGLYHALSSFEYEGKVLTNTGEFSVTE